MLGPSRTIRTEPSEPSGRNNENGNGTGVNGAVSQVTRAVILGDAKGRIFSRASDFRREPFATAL
jgi:hypothetical protein